MFKFDFDLDLDSDDEMSSPPPPPSASTSTAQPEPEQAPVPAQPFQEILLKDLISHLPAEISYSPLPLPAPLSPLARRDLFDARFQRMGVDLPEGGEAQDQADEDEEAWGPETDLVKGVYEGGLKTWECAVDLVGVLSREVVKEQGWRAVEGKSVMEVGCGTSIPTLYLLSVLLSKPPPGPSDPLPPPTSFYLLDYNKLVLQLVTLPNILLTFRHLFPIPPDSPSPVPTNLPPISEDEDLSHVPVFHPSDLLSSLPLPSSTLSSFLSLLSERNIYLSFFSGSWSSFNLPPSPGGKMDLILTSETVYQSLNLKPLTTLLRESSYPTRKGWMGEQGEDGTLVLVAAKVLYFGLEGGGVEGFLEVVRKEGSEREGGEGGWTEEVWRSGKGVGRWVGRVGWERG